MSNSLAKWGIHDFVAHDTIEVTREWQKQIEAALQSCEIFVGLVHNEFNLSHWALQEVGWAYGRSVPYYFIMFDTVPVGFLAIKQWPSAKAKSPLDAAEDIANWVSNTSTTYSDLIIYSLIEHLAQARTLPGAEEVALRIMKFGRLTPDHWQRFDEVIVSNNQIYPNNIAWRKLISYYAKHSRVMPKR